ncbi:hypothetical protein B0H65DRAFT_196001 [Neurospora tetraspora]|uniref:Uncharacterized protein n=1 Tax=Neurospora tetraspora TaxID=94610 RepID=A0AAE0JF42_9PEZI|nr:hypothetical protein B0H65DRAFT_196001 [Neurospora tetraspora]
MASALRKANLPIYGHWSAERTRFLCTVARDTERHGDYTFPGISMMDLSTSFRPICWGSQRGACNRCIVWTDKGVGEGWSSRRKAEGKQDGRKTRRNWLLVDHSNAAPRQPSALGGFSRDRRTIGLIPPLPMFPRAAAVGHGRFTYTRIGSSAYHPDIEKGESSHSGSRRHPPEPVNSLGRPTVTRLLSSIVLDNEDPGTTQRKGNDHGSWSDVDRNGTQEYVHLLC